MKPLSSKIADDGEAVNMHPCAVPDHLRSTPPRVNLGGTAPRTPGHETERAMQVEIWSDVVCPFCYVGKRRFEAALAAFPHRDAVDVTWRSFELDADAPRTQPGSLVDLLAAKYRIPREGAAEMHAHVTALAAAEGLSFRLDDARSGNTLDAHRLIHHAAAHGHQDAAKERLLRAYFSEGRAIGERATLIDLAADLGLDADEVRTMLASTAFVDAVRADEEDAARLGVRGVPFFVVDRAYGVSGAQPVEVFAQLLEHAWAAGRGAASDAEATP
jgi:predicted DsbA family dithiol-disulfide isomerase